jgi:hypothetical protein
MIRFASWRYYPLSECFVICKLLLLIKTVMASITSDSNHSTCTKGKRLLTKLLPPIKPLSNNVAKFIFGGMIYSPKFD